MEAPHSKDFKNAKRVLITGASSGIGKACALRFLDAGYRVAMVSRSQDALEEIGSHFPNQTLMLPFDVSQDGDVQKAAVTALNEFGGLDVLVNAAGVIFDGDIESSLPLEFDYTMDVNLRAPFMFMQLCLEALAQSKGCILNISCEAGSSPFPNMIGYCVSKAGLDQLTRCAALEYSVAGVRVNAICPGTVDSHLTKRGGLSAAENQEYLERAAERHPLQRVCTPDEVAKAVMYLAGDSAKHITGTTLYVDGGRSLTRSGYTPYFGQQIMDRRFEARSWRIIPRLQKWWKDDVVAAHKRLTPGTREWLNELHTSPWATHDVNQHSRYFARVHPVNMNLRASATGAPAEQGQPMAPEYDQSFGDNQAGYGSPYEQPSEQQPISPLSNTTPVRPSAGFGRVSVGEASMDRRPSMPMDLTPPPAARGAYSLSSGAEIKTTPARLSIAEPISGYPLTSTASPMPAPMPAQPATPKQAMPAPTGAPTAETTQGADAHPALAMPPPPPPQK